MRCEPSGHYRLIEPTQGKVIASHVRIARSLWSRMKGLLGRRALEGGEALMFPRCSSIHTIGMRLSIDAIFVDKAFRVVSIKEHLAPGRLVPPVWGAWGVVELAEGMLDRVGLRVGDQLRLLPADPNPPCQGEGNSEKNP